MMLLGDDVDISEKPRKTLHLERHIKLSGSPDGGSNGDGVLDLKLLTFYKYWLSTNRSCRSAGNCYDVEK